MKFIKHKFSIEMCFQSFDLLVRFLRASDENSATKCLAILNENVGVKITQRDSPSMFVEEEEEKSIDAVFSGVVTGETWRRLPRITADLGDLVYSNSL